MQAAKKGMLNIVCGFLGQIVIIAIGIVVPRLVVVSYGSEVNGLLTSETQIFTCFSLFEAGIGAASLQALYAPVVHSDREEIQGIIVATHKFYIKTGTLYAGSVILLALLYPVFVKTSISYWTVVGIIVFGGLGNCLNFLYQGKYRILMEAEGYLFIATNITTVINVITSLTKVVLLLMGYNVLAVQFSYFCINILQMLIYSFFIKKHYSWLDFNTAPNLEAISQKGATLIHQISGIIFYNTDTIFLTLILQNLKVVSVYTMYNNIIQMVNTMLVQLVNGFNFRLGQIFNTDKKEYNRLHHIMEVISLGSMFSVMTVVYICILPFMRLYTSGVEDVNYIDKLYPVFFVLVPIMSYGRNIGNNVVNFAGHFRQTQWRAVTETVLNIVISVVLIWKVGIIGALLGSIIASAYRTVDIIFYAYKHLLEGKPWLTLKRWLVCFIIFAVIVCTVNQNMLFADSYLKVVLLGGVSLIICICIYFAGLFITNKEEAKAIINMAKNYIFKKK